MDVYRVGAIGGAIAATVQVPGSKSVANRALVCAALADGVTVLHNLPDGDDTEAMLECLVALGLDVEADGDGCRFTLDGLRVRSPLRGRFNVWNCLAAIAASRAMEIRSFVGTSRSGS